MKKTIIKSLTAAAVIAVMLLVIAACGKKEVKVKITDAGVTTEVVTMTGQKIKDVLAQAEINMGEKDESEPALNTKLTEDINEIIVKRYAKVTIIRGDSKEEVELVGGDVKTAIEKSGLKVADGEIADADLDALLKDGMTVTIAKAVNVSVIADGKTSKVEVAKGAKVQDALDKAGITVGDDDLCTEKLDAEVSDGMEITIKRVVYKEETVKEVIEFETEKKTDKSLDKGKSKVAQEGENGEKEVTYKIKLVDGEEIDREVVSEKITKEAVNQIVYYGSKQAASSSSSSSSSQKSGGKTIVSKTPVYDCDGSGHGYYEIVYSDGSKGYEVF